MTDLPTDAIFKCVNLFYGMDKQYDPDYYHLGRKGIKQLKALVKRIAELEAKQGDKQ